MTGVLFVLTVLLLIASIPVNGLAGIALGVTSALVGAVVLIRLRRERGGRR